jgi:hypothetical protein
MEPLGGAKDDRVVNLISYMVGLVNFEDFHLGFENGEIQFYNFEIEEQRRGSSWNCISSPPHKKLGWHGICIAAMDAARM